MSTAEKRGADKGRAEIARVMFEEGMSIDMITKITGLSIEEFQKPN